MKSRSEIRRMVVVKPELVIKEIEELRELLKEALNHLECMAAHSQEDICPIQLKLVKKVRSPSPLT